MNKRKICVVTGTRAEYGLLYWLMKKIQQENDLELQLVVTGMHLSPEFGLTYKKIEEDDFVINEKVEILLSSDSAVGVAKSMGLATIGFADAFERLNPNLVIILGDRFEMLSVAQSALIANIPIAHIHGGELSYGSYDDSIRHAITKMSYWHFTSTEEYRNRVIQLGENPNRVWNVGALGIESILKLPLLSKEELFFLLNIKENKPYFLITQHPETNVTSEKGIDELLYALKCFENMNFIFTKSNADNGGRIINKAIENFARINKNAYVFDSLGQQKYLSAMKHAELVIGNSSSGLIEAPYMETPTVNCGQRQNGRIKPASVFNADMNKVSIVNAIYSALEFNSKFPRIFGEGKSSQIIIEKLKSIKSYHVQKEFYDL